MRFDVTTDASPAQVLEALTDFTERRPRIWHRTLDPKTYEVRIVPVDGGGSRIEAEWTIGAATRLRDKVLLGLIHRGPMHRVIARMWRRSLDEYARA